MLMVTGDAGFVGQHLTKELDKQNIKWIGYDLVRGEDIRNKHQLDKCFELNQITKVIHLAALAGVRRSKEYPSEYISTNVTGTQNIVDMCDKHNVRQLIFFSSSSVYGEGNPPVKESDNKEPLSLYGITKLAGEQIVNNSPIKSVIIRPFTIYGEEGRKDEVVYRWLEQIKSGKPITIYDEESCRGYVYVKDLVETVCKLITGLSERVIIKDTFNLGGNEVVYLKDIVKVFDENFDDLLKLNIERQCEDVKTNYADINHAKKVLGFDPKPHFEKNLSNIIKTFKKENRL